jgi:hypothetical protein
MKVAELTGALLDLWVARAERATGQIEDWGGLGQVCVAQINSFEPVPFRPSTKWSDGGPIIERDQIFLQPPSEVHYNGGPNHGWHRYDHWRATVSARTRTLPPQGELGTMIGKGGVGRGAGETPLIAAMRAKVASHYGDEVPDVV